MEKESIGKKVAQRLLQLRQSNGLTQEQLAERATIDSSVISRIERGFRTNIRLETLDKLIGALDVNYTEFFTFTDDEQIQKRIESKLVLVTDKEALQTLEKLIDILSKK
ncbi:MAG TPA: helix-turn-helix domain-containing protein [Candidatus Levilactobacillus faecigallinarum]|uniref:Helix-turn-helix domain-containing protein n=1 Tax=Candidatus Levilactobacillus faecigallinarum TaxID=2838638 RepID=A0A9D1QTK7_9LACO|nr:helix-turn-helix domain-containing protein [Candidatus Levilactobacillus faecigallinarum]